MDINVIVALVFCFSMVNSTRTPNSSNKDTCPDHCQCESATYVICDSDTVDLSYIPRVPQTTTKLVYRKNTLGDVYLDTFQNITFKNKIMLEQLDLSNNGITSISPVAFSKLVYLKELNLSNNRLLDMDGLQKALAGLEYVHIRKLILQNMFLSDENLPSNLFEPLTFHNTLQELDLASNSIANIDFLMLSNLTSLQVLSLRNNRLYVVLIPESGNFRSIQRMDFSSNILVEAVTVCIRGQAIFENLTTLTLFDNFITFVDWTTFNCLKSVTELSLGQNPIKYIPSNMISGMTSLQELAMNYMLRVPIEIAPHAFASSSLKTLSLAGNDLTMDIFIGKSLAGLDELLWLDLPGNNFYNLVNFPSNFLDTLIPPRVRVLSLQNCRLVAFPPLKCTSLYKLDLGDNLITHLENSSFWTFPNLTILNLASNRLISINEMVFPAELREQLIAVGINDNPLACACGIKWLQDWISQEPLKFMSMDTPVTCIDCYTALVIPLESYEQTCDVQERSHGVGLAASLAASGVVIFLIAVLVILNKKRIRMCCYICIWRRGGERLVIDNDHSTAI